MRLRYLFLPVKNSGRESIIKIRDGLSVFKSSLVTGQLGVRVIRVKTHIYSKARCFMIYDVQDLESYVDNDEIDAAEEGFMRGYLGKWRGI